MSFSVWKDSIIGTIFYRNQGKRELSEARRDCDDANLMLKAAAEIKDKDIIHISLPDPHDNQEFLFYQNLDRKYSDHNDGFWMKLDSEGPISMKQAFCTFICRKRGKIFFIFPLSN